jgi:hypothetical protein
VAPAPAPAHLWQPCLLCADGHECHLTSSCHHALGRSPQGVAFEFKELALEATHTATQFLFTVIETGLELKGQVVPMPAQSTEQPGRVSVDHFATVSSNLHTHAGMSAPWQREEGHEGCWDMREHGGPGAGQPAQGQQCPFSGAGGAGSSAAAGGMAGGPPALGLHLRPPSSSHSTDSTRNSPRGTGDVGGMRRARGRARRASMWTSHTAPLWWQDGTPQPAHLLLLLRYSTAA